MKDYSILENWIDDYNGAAIYSLVDDKGKRYIGQAKHLQQRLETHRRALTRAFNNKEVYVIENENLVNAARNGVKFKVEILYKIPWYENSVNMLRYYENYYLQKYGGLKNTYNSIPVYVPNWSYAPANDVTLELYFDDKEIIDFLNNMDDEQAFIKDLIRKHIESNK